MKAGNARIWAFVVGKWKNKMDKAEWDGVGVTTTCFSPLHRENFRGLSRINKRSGANMGKNELDSFVSKSTTRRIEKKRVTEKHVKEERDRVNRYIYTVPTNEGRQSWM